MWSLPWKYPCQADAHTGLCRSALGAESEHMQQKIKTAPRVYLTFLLLFATCAVNAQETPKTTKTTDPPTCRIHFTRSWEDYGAEMGTVPTGEFYRQLERVFAGVGVRLEPEPFVPWSRAIEQVVRGTGHGLSVALETPERAEVLAFLGPIFRSKWYAYKKQGADDPDLSNPKVGVYSTYSDLAPVQKAVEDINGEIVGMPLPRLSRLLEENRVDILYAPAIGIGYLQERMNLALEKIPGIEFEMLSYVAIRKDAPCMKQKEALNEALIAWSETEIAQSYAVASPLSRTFTEVLESAKKHRQ